VLDFTKDIIFCFNVVFFCSSLHIRYSSLFLDIGLFCTYSYSITEFSIESVFPWFWLINFQNNISLGQTCPCSTWLILNNSNSKFRAREDSSLSV
jgi:hypothetical protein